VVKASQFLMNARARNEAMRLIDVGQFTEAGVLLGSSLRTTREACAPLAMSESMMEECASLEEAAMSLKDRLKDKLNRKRLAYGAHRIRVSK
jgi:hypothetical protein